MAILRVQTSTAREGKTEEFNSMIREGAELMNSKGINTCLLYTSDAADED